MGRFGRSALIVCAAVLLVGAAASQRVNPLTKIHPGKTTSADIEAVFGPPVSGAAATCATFKPDKKGVRELIAWFGKDSKLKWARIKLTNNLPPEAVALLFEATGEPIITTGNAFSPADDASLTQHYEGSVHVVVSGGIAKEIWLTGPDDRPSDVAKEAKIPESGPATPAAAPAQPTTAATTAQATPAHPGATEVAAPSAPGTQEGPTTAVGRSATGAGETPAAVTPSAAGTGETAPPAGMPGAASAPTGIERSDFAPPEQPVTGLTEYKTGAVVSVAPQGAAGAAAPGPGPVMRSLNVTYVWAALSQDPASPGGLDVFARVSALGLKDQTVAMTLGLRPAGSLGPTPNSNLSLSGKALYDDSTWQQARILVPAANLPGGQPVGILHWQAESSGLVSYAEAAYGLGVAGALAAPRALTMSNLRIEQNAQLQQYTGIWAYADVGAVNVRGRTLVAEVRFRIPGGAALRPPQGSQGVSGPDGALAITQQDTILHDSANWNPFRIFVPYGAFGLPGGAHRLLMTYRAFCDDLSAASEQDIDVVVP